MAEPLYERVRFRDVLDDNRMVELDAIHARTSRWAEVLADEPSFASWRIARFPSGWTVAVEPLSATLPRLLATGPDSRDRLADRG